LWPAARRREAGRHGPGFAAPLTKGLIPGSTLADFAAGANDVCTVIGIVYCLRNDLSQAVLWYDAPLMKKFGSHRRGTALQQYTHGGGSNQLWYFESRQILEVSGGSTANGAAISQWMPLNQSNQARTIQ
jgi:hypothetical protein